MALPKISETRELSDEALREAILNTKRELFTLRMKVATRQPVKPHEFKHAKHRLAQLMTVENERMRQAAAANAAE
ncbi:MAG TPA: 50S ribosomal protein L29 [Cyanobacteria bacterium UBA8156]|jgi:large subunit ribosomal protein L29|nr:50S ribosomal protein L29 [Cyanobacteria bacterium UBA8156]